MVTSLLNLIQLHQKRVLQVLGILIGIAFVALLLRYQLKLVHYIQWQDESETIVVTKMMAQGARLYTDVYNNHGPMTFVIGFILSKLGNFPIEVYRYPMILLQWLALASIYFSPIQGKSYIKRLGSVTLIATFWMLFLPFIYGHTYLYQTQSGLFFIIVLMQYALPIYLGKTLNRFQKFIGPFLLVCIPFLAVTNVPMAGLLALTTIRREDNWTPWLGYVVGLLFNVGFLVTYGSIDGYIAYHFYLNAVVLNEGNGASGYVRNIITYYRENFANFMTLCLLILIVHQITKRAKGINIFRALFLLPMAMSLVIRGGMAFDLWGLVYLYVLSGLSMVFFLDDIEIEDLGSVIQLWPIALVMLLGLYSLFRTSFIEQHMYAIPQSTPFSQIAERVTQPEDKVVALTFRSFEYLASNRMPASAHFIYLPIQADYNKIPYKNIKSDLLQDIQNVQPKLIVMDQWSSTDVPWNIYAKDVLQYVMNHYQQIGTTDMYYRNDLDLKALGVDPYTGDILK